METEALSYARSSTNLLQCLSRRQLGKFSLYNPYPTFRKQQLNSSTTHSSSYSQILANPSWSSRLTLKKTLKGHRGCVNSIEWNREGTILITGSDDRRINLHSAFTSDYKQSASLVTSHRGNIFHAVMTPDGTNNTIISCGMDGFLCVNDVTKNTSKLIGAFDNMIFKVEFLPNSQTNFLTTHQNGKIRLWDLRKSNISNVPPMTMDDNQNVILKGKCSNVSANSVKFSKVNEYIMATGGEDEFVKLYDIRFLNPGKSSSGFLKKFSPTNLKIETVCQNEMFDRTATYITGIDFNIDNEIVATYSRFDVYLYDASDNYSGKNSDNDLHEKQVYKGRVNKMTFLKEVAFFGDGAYVVTGSDCGNMFIWEKQSGKLVQILRADNHVVNGIAPHPWLPYIAICGIDSEAKVFEPCDKNTFSTKYAMSVIETNTKQTGKLSSANMWDVLNGRNQLDRDSRSWSIQAQFLTDEEANNRIIQSNSKRSEANELFKNSSYENAINKYEEAIEILNFERAADDEIRDLQIQSKILCLLNKAACNLKLNRNDEVIKDCTLVLTIQKDNVKALVRRGNAFININDFDKAQEDLRNAYHLCPDDNLIKKLIQELKTKKEQLRERERRAFSGMFEKL